MTPKERAREATWEAGCPDWTSDDQEQLEAAVEQAIIAAVLEEREACAKVCDERAEGDVEWYMRLFAEGIAEDIRARSNNGGEK